MSLANTVEATNYPFWEISGLEVKDWKRWISNIKSYNTKELTGNNH